MFVILSIICLTITAFTGNPITGVGAMVFFAIWFFTSPCLRD